MWEVEIWVQNITFEIWMKLFDSDTSSAVSYNLYLPSKPPMIRYDNYRKCSKQVQVRKVTGPATFAASYSSGLIGAFLQALSLVPRFSSPFWFHASFGRRVNVPCATWCNDASFKVIVAKPFAYVNMLI